MNKDNQITNGVITENRMIDSIRQRFMFVDVESTSGGLKRLIISHKSSRTIAEYCSSDKGRMAELALHYGL